MAKNNTFTKNENRTPSNRISGSLSRVANSIVSAGGTLASAFSTSPTGVNQLVNQVSAGFREFERTDRDLKIRGIVDDNGHHARNVEPETAIQTNAGNITA